MKNFVKRIIAFVHGIIAGVLLYKFFTNSVLLNYLKKDFERKPVYRVRPYYTDYSFYKTRSNDFDIFDFGFGTRSDAEQVLNQIKMEIEKNGLCTIGRLKELSGIESLWSDQHKGWTELSENVRVNRCRDGKYYIDLPDPEELD